MTIHVSWHNEDKTVLIITFEGTYSWDDLRAAYQQAWVLVRSQPHTVHMLTDSTRGPMTPSGNALGNYRTIASDKPDNLGMTYVIGAGSVGKTLSMVFTKALRRESRVHFVRSIEEAEAMIGATTQDATPDQVETPV
jgi:hypothetical protein